MTGPDLAHGAAIGRFTIVRLLGAGGMGQVYEARDPQLARSVAIKLLRAGATGGIGLRLLREAQALARVQHPNVVAVHELGEHDGHAFVAMELVDGESLERYLAHARPDWRGVVALFAQAARGLAAVHAAGLIHRDVKPANLFVDAAGRVRVGDFGLVRLVEGRDSPAPDDEGEPSARRAASAATIGDGEATPSSIAAGNGAPVDPHEPTEPADREIVVPSGADLLRADMTHAGTVLGTPLFMSPEQHLGVRATPASDQFSLCVAMWRALFREHPFDGEGRAIIDATIAGRRRDHDRGPVPRWLVRALDRGLAVDPAQRHPSMDALLRVFERGVGRRRVAVIALAAALAVVVAFSSWRIVTEMRRADREAAEVRRRADEATLARAADLLAVDPTRALEQLARLSPGAPEWRLARTIAADAHARGIARSHRFIGRVTTLAFSATGARLAGLGDSVLHVWDMPGAGLRTFPHPQLAAIAWDGEQLVGADLGGTFVRIDAATGAARPLRSFPGRYVRVAIAPGGRRAVLVDERRNAQLVALDTGDARAIAGQHPAWSADGKYLATGDDRQSTTGRINLGTGELQRVIDRIADRVAATEARTWIADAHGHVWVTSDLGPYRLDTRHDGMISALVPLADGRVATASTQLTRGLLEGGTVDTAITLADASPHRTITLRGHVDEVDAVAVAPDGTLASTDRAGVLRVWKTAPRFTLGDGLEVATDAVYDAARAELVVVHRGPELQVVHAGTRATRRVFEVDGVTLPRRREARRGDRVDGDIMPERYWGRDTLPVATSAALDRRVILTVDRANRAILWDLASSRGRLVGDDITGGTLCPDGVRAILTDTGDGVYARDLVAGTSEQLGVFGILAAACSRSGALAIARSNGLLYLVAGGAASQLEETTGERIRALAFSPDGASLISAGDGRAVHVWDVATGKLRARHDGHTGAVTYLAWLPDGRLASGATDGTIIVWDLAGARERLELRGHTRAIRSIAFRGERAVTVAIDHTARVWDLAGPIGRPLPGPDVHAAFAPDGSVITVDAHAYLDWFPDDDLPATEDGLRAWIAAHL